jgi:hypothetical protein
VHYNSGRLNSTPKAASDKNQGKIDYWTEAIIYRIVMQVEDSSYSLVWLLLFSGGRDGSYMHVKTVACGTTCKSSCSRRIGNPALKGLNSVESVCMYRDSIFRTSYNIGKLILFVIWSDTWVASQESHSTRYWVMKLCPWDGQQQLCVTIQKKHFLNFSHVPLPFSTFPFVL